jgi:hypothetical protein
MLDRRLSTSDEFGLHATPGCSGDDRLFDELRERFTLTQDGLDLGPDFGLDSNGRKGRGAHGFNV